MSSSITASTLPAAAALTWGLKSSCESGSLLKALTDSRPPAAHGGDLHVVRCCKGGSQRHGGGGVTCALQFSQTGCTLRCGQELPRRCEEALHSVCFAVVFELGRRTIELRC